LQPQHPPKTSQSFIDGVLEGILAIETENGREAAREFLLYIYQLREELLGQMAWITG